MNTLVHYNLQNNIATIRIDDGKRNALSPAVLLCKPASSMNWPTRPN